MKSGQSILNSIQIKLKKLKKAWSDFGIEKPKIKLIKTIKNNQNNSVIIAKEQSTTKKSKCKHQSKISNWE